MSRSPSVAAWIAAMCLLITFSFTTGYLLLSRSNTPPPSARPIDAPGLTAAASSPSSPVALSVTGSPAPAVVPAEFPAGGPRTPAADPGARGRRPSGAGSVCSFDATVYDVRLSADQIGRLDVDALTKAAATSESFEKALAALGPTRPLYRANLPVSFDEEQYVIIDNDMPAAAGNPATSPGKAMGLKPSGNPGAVFDLLAKEGDAGTINLLMSIDASILVEVSTPGTATAHAPVVRTAKIYQQRFVAPDRPFLFVNADAATLDANGKAVAFIARVILGAPQSPAAPPATAK